MHCTANRGLGTSSKVVSATRFRIEPKVHRVHSGMISATATMKWRPRGRDPTWGTTLQTSRLPETPCHKVAPRSTIYRFTKQYASPSRHNFISCPTLRAGRPCSGNVKSVLSLDLPALTAELTRSLPGGRMPDPAPAQHHREWQGTRLPCHSAGWGRGTTLLGPGDSVPPTAEPH